jgi:hypothetical protein
MMDKKHSIDKYLITNVILGILDLWQLRRFVQELAEVFSK